MVIDDIVRRTVLAGVLALPLSGLAGLGAAQAMPAAPLAARASSSGPTDVSYSYRYRPYNRHRRAGPYGCGPHALSTHLERQACGYSGRGRNGRYR